MKYNIITGSVIFCLYRRLFQTALVVDNRGEVELVDTEQQRGLRGVAHLSGWSPFHVGILLCLPPCYGCPFGPTTPTTLQPSRSRWWRCGIQGKERCPSRPAWRCRCCQRGTEVAETEKPFRKNLNLGAEASKGHLTHRSLNLTEWTVVRLATKAQLEKMAQLAKLEKLGQLAHIYQLCSI